MVSILPWEMHDADALSKLVSEVSEVDLRNSRLVQNAGMAVDWIANLSALQFHGEYHFAIWDNDTLVGDAGFRVADSPFILTASVFWAIPQKFKYEDLMSEVVSASLAAFKNKTNSTVLVTSALVEDQATILALNTNKFRHVGTYHGVVFESNKFKDLAVFECINSEFMKKSDKFASRTAEHTSRF